MTKPNRIADLSKPVDYSSYVYLALLAFFANIVSKVTANAASQNQAHKRCINGLTGTFNVTRTGETCNFSFSSVGIETLGKCSWCPPFVPTPKPTRRPQIAKTGNPVSPPKTEHPVPPPTDEPTPKPSPGPTKAKVTKRPTRPPRPTPKPTRRPTCMSAIGVPSSSLKQLALESSEQQSRGSALQLLPPGLMRFMLDGLFKYCVLSVVGKNIFQLPATCMFQQIGYDNGTVGNYYIPPEFYSAELKSGYGDFDPAISYPGISVAFYPTEFLGSDPMAFNFAYLVASAPISVVNEMSGIDQSASQVLLAYVNDETETPAPSKKSKGRLLLGV